VCVTPIVLQSPSFSFSGARMSRTSNLKSQTSNPKPQTPNPKPQTPNPKPQTPAATNSSLRLAKRKRAKFKRRCRRLKMKFKKRRENHSTTAQSHTSTHAHEPLRVREGGMALRAFCFSSPYNPKPQTPNPKPQPLNPFPFRRATLCRTPLPTTSFASLSSQRCHPPPSPPSSSPLPPQTPLPPPPVPRRVGRPQPNRHHCTGRFDGGWGWGLGGLGV